MASIVSASEVEFKAADGSGDLQAVANSKVHIDHYALLGSTLIQNCRQI